MTADRSVATLLICASLVLVAPAMAASPTFTAKGIACDNAADIGELTRLAAEAKRTVFDAYGFAKIVHGQCIELSAGTKVTIESADAANLAIRVCRSGGACLWMSPEAVDGLTPEGLQNALKRLPTED